MRITKSQAATLETLGMKWCPKCQSAKFARDFFAGTGRMGLQSYCKACFHQGRPPQGERKRLRLTNEAYNALHSMGLDYCPDCRRILEFSEYTKDSRTMSGRSVYCRNCSKARKERSE